MTQLPHSWRQNRRHRRSTGRPRQLWYGKRRHTRTRTTHSSHHVLARTSRASIIGYHPFIINLPPGEIPTELLTFFQSPHDVSSAQRREAAIGLADSGLGALFTSHLDDEGAALDGVYEDVARLEVRVRRP